MKPAVACDRVDDLGGTARHLLYSERPTDGGARFREALRYVTEQLARARHRADELSKSGGAPRNYARVYLAALVAHAIASRLGVKPTMTRGGLFEDILATVIEAVEKRKNPSVQDLMRAGLAAQVSERPDGGIEIDPRVGYFPPKKCNNPTYRASRHLYSFRHEWQTEQRAGGRAGQPERGEPRRSDRLWWRGERPSQHTDRCGTIARLPSA